MRWMVTAAGGTGIPVRVDHEVETEVAALFARVRRERKRLDVLATVITGQPASWKNFLNESPDAGRAFVESWIWPHIVTSWHAAKLCQAGCVKSAAAGRAIRRLRSIDRAQGRERRHLIGGHPGSDEAGDRKSGQQADQSDHNDHFEHREALRVGLPIQHTAIRPRRVARRRPSRHAVSRMWSAIRSLMLPVRLSDSTFAYTTRGRPSKTTSTARSGVLPISR